MQIWQKPITRNFTPGRHAADGSAITNIIVHTYGGAGVSLQSWFQNNDRNVSSHYAVRKDGLIEQYVKDEDTAHANGHNWYNAHGISIEFQDDNNPGDSIRTNELYESGAQLIFTLALKYRIPINRERVKGHNEVLAEIGGTRFCPGGLNINRLVQRALQLMQEYEQLKAQVQTLLAENAVLKAGVPVETQRLLDKYREEIDNKALSISQLQVKNEAMSDEIERLQGFKASRFYQLYLLFKGNQD